MRSSRLASFPALVVLSALAATATPTPTSTTTRHAPRPRRRTSPITDYLFSGYHPSFSSNLSSIVAYTPPSPWFDAASTTTLPSLFPSCQHSEWCDTPYTDTLAVQAALHAAQHPADCAAARMLVVTAEWTSGFGSTLAIHAYTLALALSDNRVLVRAPDAGVPFSPRSLCACDRIGHACDGSISSLDCLFIPLSHCTPPADWRSTAPRWTLGSSARIVQAPSMSEVDAISQCEATVQARPPSPLARYADRPPSWWHAQLLAYITRPRPATLTDIVAPAMASTFWRHGGLPPRPLVAVFVRGGDKASEATLVGPAAALAAATPIAAKLNASHLYVSSDDAALIDGVADAVQGEASSPSFPNLYWIDSQRPLGGAQFTEMMSWANTWRMERVVRLAVADLYITAMADVVGGTLSSNWCRTADALRRAAGRGRVPYATPEGSLYYSVCENVLDDAPLHARHVAEWPQMTARLRAATEGSWPS